MTKLNPEANQAAFNRNFKNANYGLEEIGAVISGAVENLLDDDYENNRGLVYKVE